MSYNIRLTLYTILIIFFIGCGGDSSDSIKKSNSGRVIVTPADMEVTPPKTEPKDEDYDMDMSEIEESQDGQDDQEYIKDEEINSSLNSSADNIEDSSDSQESDIDDILSNIDIKDNSSSRDNIRGEGESATPNSSSYSYRDRFINKSSCNQIIDKEFLVICYDYRFKEAKSVAYKLDGELVNELNIAKRPSFYQEREVAEEYRADYSDYTGSGYDRGHLAPDASFDWSEESLNATYSLANIVPQAPTVNRRMWVKVEDYEREKAVSLGEVDIINLVEFDNNPDYIGDNLIAVPKGFYKILYNKSENYRECFYYKNDLSSSSVGDTVEKHRVDCSNIAM